MTEEAGTVKGRTELHMPLDGDGCLIPDEQQPTFVSYIDSLRGTTAWSPSEKWVIPKRPHTDIRATTIQRAGILCDPASQKDASPPTYPNDSHTRFEYPYSSACCCFQLPGT
jgi:hypothetical protein